MFKFDVNTDIIRILETFVEMVEVKAEQEILVSSNSNLKLEVTQVIEGAHYRAMHTVLNDLKSSLSREGSV
jgi:hypothetical protein